MKAIFLFLFLCTAMCSIAQNTVQKPPVKTTVTPVKLLSSADSVQYALGAFIGLWLNRNALPLTNMSLFQRGLDDILQNRPRIMPDSAVGPKIDTYQESMQKTKGQQEEKRLFDGLKDVAGIGMFPNGVRYTVSKTGKGPRPAEKDSILLHVLAKLPDGTVVEDTYSINKPFSAMTNSFFPGLNDALPMMTEGSRWMLYVPAALAYGDQGTARIPANSALVLDIELVQVRKMP